MPKFMISREGRLEENTELSRVFPFLYESGHIISLVGGGGKTSLMYYFAKKAQEKMNRVTVTTTTHICKPEDEKIYAETLQEAEQLWEHGSYVVCGTEDGEKLSMLPFDILERFLKKSDLVCIEADGAKRLPCKVPNQKEPVILPQSDIVVAVIGLSALGKPVEKVCFRTKQAQKLLGMSGNHLMTEEDFAHILCSEQGSKKSVKNRDYYIILNQCDGKKEEHSAIKIIKLLSEKGITKVVACSIEESLRNKR